MSRKFAFLVVAEIAVVAALAIATWNLVHSRLQPRAGPVALLPAPSPTPTPSATPAAPPQPTPTAKPALGPPPGLATDRAFVSAQAVQINHDESAWQKLEWQAAQTVIRFARAYLEEVVVPAVEKAAG
ncbi:MAG TPA: hypothetical protein VF134_07125 [Candidatus Dormibacteraeota bacterium]